MMNMLYWEKYLHQFQTMECSKGDDIIITLIITGMYFVDNDEFNMKHKKEKSIIFYDFMTEIFIFKSFHDKTLQSDTNMPCHMKLQKGSGDPARREGG